MEEIIDLNVPIELRNDVVDDSDDEWYDCEVINKHRKFVKKTGDSNEIFTVPPQLEYLCLRNNIYFPSIVLLSLSERDRGLLMQILKRNSVEIKIGQDLLDITGLRMREHDASDTFNDTT